MPGTWAPCGRAEPQGGTALEALVVLAIIAAGTFAVLRTEPLRARLALHGAATTLVAELRAAQARALAERDPDRLHGLEFPASGESFVVFVRRQRLRTGTRVHPLPPPVRITHARFGGSPSRTVTFSGVSLYGAPSGGGTITLTSGGARLCIRVLPATGRVRVQAAGCP